jgi:hypothetical protein
MNALKTLIHIVQDAFGKFGVWTMESKAPIKKFKSLSECRRFIYTKYENPEIEVFRNKRDQ